MDYMTKQWRDVKVELNYALKSAIGAARTADARVRAECGQAIQCCPLEKGRGLPSIWLIYEHTYVDAPMWSGDYPQRNVAQYWHESLKYYKKIIKLLQEITPEKIEEEWAEYEKLRE